MSNLEDIQALHSLSDLAVALQPADAGTTRGLDAIATVSNCCKLLLATISSEHHGQAIGSLREIA